jgi:hypothetical protein
MTPSRESLCVPTKPFRCWQYRKDSTANVVPEWAMGWGYQFRNKGEWLVELYGHCRWYTPAEFQERFRVEEGNE